MRHRRSALLANDVARCDPGNAAVHPQGSAARRTLSAPAARWNGATVLAAEP